MELCRGAWQNRCISGEWWNTYISVCRPKEAHLTKYTMYENGLFWFTVAIWFQQHTIYWNLKKEERIGPSNEWFHSFSLVQILMGCSVLCYWNLNKNQCHKATALICNRSTERLNFMIQWKAQLALCSFSLGLKPQKYTIKENIIKLPIIWNGEYRIWLSTVGHKTNRKAPH